MIKNLQNISPLFVAIFYRIHVQIGEKVDKLFLQLISSLNYWKEKLPFNIGGFYKK